MERLACTMFLVATLVACGDGGGGGDIGDIELFPHPGPPIYVAGTWSGPYTSTVFGPQTMTLDLHQMAGIREVTGTYSSSTGATGTVHGLASEDSFGFGFTLTTPGCTGSFQGTGDVDTGADPDRMSIQLSGSSTCGGDESITAILTKQQQ